MDNTAFEKAIFELAAYITISARNLLEEPARYGPFRLVDAASRLIAILQTKGAASDRLLLLREKIEMGKQTAMGSEEEFTAFLEELVLIVVEEIEKETE